MKNINLGQWVDADEKEPTVYGQYLCLVKWYDSLGYYYELVEYNEGGWQLTDSAEHIVWASEVLDTRLATCFKIS